MMIAREHLARTLSRAWPGLVHFGVRPLCIEAPFPVKSVKVFVAYEGILHLRRLEFRGGDAKQVASGRYSQSSVHASSCPAHDLLKGKWIHTVREKLPSWQANFPSPLPVASIDIYNRIGAWAHRSYGLCVEMHGEASTVMFDNLAAPTIQRRALRLCEDGLAALAQHSAAREGPEWATLIRQAQSALSGLRRAVQAFMEGEGLAPDPTSQRLELSAALVALVDALCGPTTKGANATALRSLLTQLSDLLDSLCPKAAASLVDEQHSLERDMAAIFLTASVMTAGKASLDLVEEYNHFVSEPQGLVAVEARVNSLLRQAQVKGIEMPVVFRAHGLAGSSLQTDPRSYLESMKEVADALDQLGYEGAICYGTLLGAVRERGFIPHDDDVDMAVVLKDSQGLDCRAELKALAARLTDMGFVTGFCEGHDFLKAKAPKGKRYVDLFPISPDGQGNVWMFMQQLKMRAVAAELVLPLRTVDLYDFSYRAPANIEGFLADRYGADWQVPQRFVGSKRISMPLVAPVKA